MSEQKEQGIRLFIRNIGKEVEAGNAKAEVNHGYMYFRVLHIKDGIVFDEKVDLAIVGNHFFLGIKGVPIIDLNPEETKYLYSCLTKAMDQWAENLKGAASGGFLRDKIRAIEQWYPAETKEGANV